jgi:hypothetical protein
MNDDKNMLGRIIALALLAGAAYGVHSIAHGGFACPVGGGSSCVMAIPAAFPAPPVDVNVAPVEKAEPVDANGDDEDAKLEKKAPVVPPSTSK